MTSQMQLRNMRLNIAGDYVNSYIMVSVLVGEINFQFTFMATHVLQKFK